MDTSMLATDRLLEAQRLIQSVIDGLDTSLVDCPCPEHARHYSNWSDAQTHIRLQGLVDRLGREAHNDSVTALTARERKDRGWLVRESVKNGKVVQEHYRRRVTE